MISLLIHGFLSVNARLLIAFGTAFYAIIIDSFLFFCSGASLSLSKQHCLSYLFGVILRFCKTEITTVACCYIVFVSKNATIFGMHYSLLLMLN